MKMRFYQKTATETEMSATTPDATPISMSAEPVISDILVTASYVPFAAFFVLKPNADLLKKFFNTWKKTNNAVMNDSEAKEGRSYLEHRENKLPLSFKSDFSNLKRFETPSERIEQNTLTYALHCSETHFQENELLIRLKSDLKNLGGDN